MNITKGQVPTEYYASLHAAIHASDGDARQALEAEMHEYLTDKGLLGTVLDNQFATGAVPVEAVTFVMRNGRQLVCRTDDAREVAMNLSGLPGWKVRKTFSGDWRVTARRRTGFGARRFLNEAAETLVIAA
jgi:hypothetical protein